jgi:hypothetical protein
MIEAETRLMLQLGGDYSIRKHQACRLRGAASIPDQIGSHNMKDPLRARLQSMGLPRLQAV